MRNQVISRYPNFFQNLLTSPSKEIRLQANIVSRDPHSFTARNINYIKELTDLSVWDFASWRIKEALPAKTVPKGEGWRLGLLGKLIVLRRCKSVCVEDSKKISAMLESLCDT